MDHSETGHFRPFEYRTVWVSGIQMNPVFGNPVIGWLQYFVKWTKCHKLILFLVNKRIRIIFLLSLKLESCQPKRLVSFSKSNEKCIKYKNDQDFNFSFVGRGRPSFADKTGRDVLHSRDQISRGPELSQWPTPSLFLHSHETIPKFHLS